MAAAPPPAGFGVRLAPGVLVRDGGRVLAGGVPLRLVRLSPAGAALVARWRAGAPLGEGGSERVLARRLLDGGLLDARPAPAADDVWRAAIAIVVPARDRPEMLARCLRSLRGSAGPEPDLVVVDDGSRDAAAIARTAAACGGRIVRHTASRGAGAARNTGLAATTAPLVAFVDSDVVVDADDGWLRRLVAHLDDPAVGAVAPRVRALDERTRNPLAGYERRHSSLDMGPAGGIVGPGLPISYVPSATLLVRRAAVPAGGFAEDMPVGEDVDFCWRTSVAGTHVRYVPESSVRHEHRIELLPFMRRRHAYARSIGPLSRRHPEALPAVRADLTMALAVSLAAARRPRAALLTAGFCVVRARRTLNGNTTLAAILVIRGLAGTAHGIGHATRRTWSPPLLAVGLRHPRVLRPLVMAYALRMVQPGAPRRPGDLVLATLDDLIAALGTWEGSLRLGTPVPLLPRFRMARGGRRHSDLRREDRRAEGTNEDLR